MRGQIAVFQYVLAFWTLTLDFDEQQVYWVQATEYALYRAGFPETVEGEGNF